MLVTLAAQWTGPKGGKHKANETVDMPAVEARELLYRGLARLPEQNNEGKGVNEND